MKNIGEYFEHKEKSIEQKETKGGDQDKCKLLLIFLLACSVRSPRFNMHGWLSQHMFREFLCSSSRYLLFWTFWTYNCPHFNRYLLYQIFPTSSIPNSTDNPILVENTEFRAHRNRFFANSKYFVPEFPELLSLQGFCHEVSPHYVCRTIFNG